MSAPEKVFNFGLKDFFSAIQEQLAGLLVDDKTLLIIFSTELIVHLDSFVLRKRKVEGKRNILTQMFMI